MSDPLGTMVVGEYTFTIIHISLQRGGFRIVAQYRGSTKSQPAMRPTIYDKDGNGVLQGEDGITIEVTYFGAVTTITYELDVLTVTGKESVSRS